MVIQVIHLIHLKIYILYCIDLKILYQKDKYDEVVFNKGLVYLKKDMSLLTGKINGKNYKGEFVNGKKEGLHRKWHDNGQLEKEGSYVNDKREGLWRFWGENGQLEKEESYLNGKLIR